MMRTPDDIQSMIKVLRKALTDDSRKILASSEERGNLAALLWVLWPDLDWAEAHQLADLPASIIYRIPVKEVAKIIRNELKQRWPAARFTVRCERGLTQGIVVRWSTIVPTRQAVHEHVGHFRGGELDVLDNWRYRPTEWNGRQVQFENMFLRLESPEKRK